jgi:endo-1,4-beta-xylanase
MIHATIRPILFFILITASSQIFGQQTYLKDAVPYRFGASVNPRLLMENSAYKQLVLTEFNSITAENHMKMMLIHPAADKFDFSKADYILDFAKRNQKRVHGHTLVWHNQVPAWMKDFQGDSNAWENMLKTHIQTVVTHFKGQIAGWDVVNESYLDDGSVRPSIWSEHIQDYIAKSFQWAHEADPDAILFYNDYGQDGKPKKMQAILNLVKDLQKRNIPIHGLGLQMHVNIGAKNADILEVIEQASKTGLYIHFSELDVAVNPKNKADFEYNAAAKKAQAEKYDLIFSAYAAIPKAQQYGITQWNVGDADSWLRSFFKRPKEFPLLFDDQYARKPFYQTILSSK